MCDEYEDERMAVFWRRLEQMERRDQASSEPDEVAEPLVRIEPAPPPAPKANPRALTH